MRPAAKETFNESYRRAHVRNLFMPSCTARLKFCNWPPREEIYVVSQRKITNEVCKGTKGLGLAWRGLLTFDVTQRELVGSEAGL